MTQASGLAVSFIQRIMVIKNNVEGRRRALKSMFLPTSPSDPGMTQRELSAG